MSLKPSLLWDIDPKDHANRGLSYRDIEWLLDSIPAQNKVVLLDACRSGAQDRDTTINNRESFVFMQETFINLSRHNHKSAKLNETSLNVLLSAVLQRARNSSISFSVSSGANPNKTLLSDNSMFATTKP